MNSPPSSSTLAAPVSGQAKKTITVGSGDMNHCVVKERGVSARHCSISLMSDQTVVLQDLNSTNGTFINGKTLQGTSMAITPNDRITLGPLVALTWSVIEEKLFGRTTAMTSLKIITVGSAPDNDVVLSNPRISRHHLKIFGQEDRFIVEDLKSSNGTALNRRDNLIQTASVGLEDVLYIADQRMAVRQLVMPPENQTRAVKFAGVSMIIGRSPEADVVIDHPTVSLKHLRVTQGPRGIEIEDLTSMNGTYVNGVRLTAPTLLGPNDELSLGAYIVKLDDQGVHRCGNEYRLTANHISLSVNGAGGTKTLLDRISFSLYPGEFTGLMGTSGAGKTTLLRTALGYYRPTEGSVTVNGHNLHRAYDRFRTSLGYVPQEDIMHSDLTVEQSLKYSAMLRLGRESSAAEVNRLIDKVLTELGLFDANPDIRTTRISQISGGQRRRVNMAIELLVDPSIFFLDEPTSGLSSQDAMDVMTMLRGLADQGKVILLTLHQPSLEAYKLMDRMIFLHKGGRMAYFGATWPESLIYTNPNLKVETLTSPDLALTALSAEDPVVWQQRYLASPEHETYVTQRLAQEKVVETGESAPPRKGSLSWQWWILTCRSFRIKLQDTMNSAILLLQAPIIASLIALTFGQSDDKPFDPKYASIALFLVVVSSVWFGCSNAARDICGEWSIYQRERMYNLSLVAYTLSKTTIGALVCAIQCAILLAVVVPTCRLAAPIAPLYGMVLLTAVTGGALGLLVSAFASPFKKRTEIAIGMIPLLLIPMVVLGGVIKPLKEMGTAAESIASLMISRWSFEGLLHLEAAQHGRLQEPMKAAFLSLDNTFSTGQTTFILIGFLMLFLSGTMALLKRQDII